MVQQQQQWLVRFQNRTHVVNVSPVCHDDDDQAATASSIILNQLSYQTKWPTTRMEIVGHLDAAPFCEVRIVSSVRGGKGGFGTLLKGQSKQAGAKQTTDFGACRDLQGRRLRHVNDEIKLRKWRELQKRKQEGLLKKGGKEEETKMMFETPSGLYNWHLMVPNWASISDKGTRKLQRQMERDLQRERTEEEKADFERKERERMYQESIATYVRQTAEAAETIAVQDAIQQGLAAAAAAKKRKAVAVQSQKEEQQEEEEEEKKNSLVTLSGDVVVDETDTAQVGAWQLQSKSDFGTMALVLDKAPEDSDARIYFEVQVVSGGLAQIGWADLTDFAPDTDSGDGVGDVGSSYAFDGSRCKKFHIGSEQDYGQSWTAGDVIGCKYDISTGVISFAINGQDMGEAFTVDKTRPLVPALSCNGGEILELHVHPDQMKFLPGDCVPVFELLTPDAPIQEGALTDTSIVAETVAAPPESPSAKANEAEQPAKKKKKAKPAPVLAEPLDLNQYASEVELEALGLERLKAALLAIGVKCGGSLQERAARLWSLKGLAREEYPVKVRAKNFKL